MSDPWKLSLRQAAAAIAAGSLTPDDLLQSTFGRIDAVEPRVLAWARLSTEDAHRQAAQLTTLQARGTILGPLHGIPLGVKDIFNTAGLETACGSKIMGGFVPAEDAAAVARLRAGGAIILGKTHTTEFASFDPSPARNPWAPDHTPGGSSSGSGAALAARMCLGALGSQTSGSILRPAAFCGVVGLKPTFGRVSRYGVHPLAWTLDHPGPMARTVRDVAMLLEVIAGPDARDPSTLSAPAPVRYASLLEQLASDGFGLNGLTVGVPDRYFADGADAEAEDAYRSALRLLEAKGCRLSEARLPPQFEAGMDAHEIIFNTEAAAVHLDRYRQRPQDYRPMLRAIIETGLQIPAPTYVRAQQVRTLLIRGMRALLTDVDAIATPATLGPAPRGLESTGSPILNRPFSFVGFPSLSVPCGFTQAGLPLGLQLAGRPFDEMTILRLAAAYEEATGWGQRLPPV